MVRRVARKRERVGPGLVGLVRDAVEAAQVEEVERARDDDAVQPPRVHRREQPLEVAEALWQRLSLVLHGAIMPSMDAKELLQELGVDLSARTGKDLLCR